MKAMEIVAKKETAELLCKVQEILEYDPETGLIKWKKTGSGRKHKGWFRGNSDKDGYRRIMISGKMYTVHRLGWALSFGGWPVGEIDHKNQVKSDNRLENLKEATHQENTRNQKLKRNSTSGVTGVCFVNREQKWMASIRVDGKFKGLGVFSVKDDAIAARQAANIKYGFSPIHGKPS